VPLSLFLKPLSPSEAGYLAERPWEGAERGSSRSWQMKRGAGAVEECFCEVVCTCGLNGWQLSFPFSFPICVCPCVANAACKPLTSLPLQLSTVQPQPQPQLQPQASATASATSFSHSFSHKLQPQLQPQASATSFSHSFSHKLLLVSLRLAISSCVTALFLLGLFWGLPRSHRLSSHSRLNAFVIQTKLS